MPPRVAQTPQSPPEPSSPPPQHLPPPVAIDTEPNDFGIYRSYTKWPTLDPEDTVGLAEVCDSTGLEGSDMKITPSQSAKSNILSPSPTSSTADTPFDPFPNATIFRLMNWWYGGSTMKSAAELDRLVNDVLLQDDFSQEHLRGFSCAREAGRLDRHGTAHTTLSPSKGWMESTVKITLPAECIAKGSEPQSAEYDIPGVFHRSLTEIVKQAFQDTGSQTFHLTPFKQFWKPVKDKPPVRLHSELYTSDAMLEEYNKICSSPGEPGCKLERVVASIMVWSDTTHLTNFGAASLWPIYLFFGNQSKYTRAKPKSFACHHLAYIPSVSYEVVFAPQLELIQHQLPDTLQDQYREIFGTSASDDVLTHCKRELMHSIWELLLDEEFMHAYEHGIVIMFPDGIARRVYPRIFTYSADYPEK
jgi:hypothetical protein